MENPRVSAICMTAVSGYRGEFGVVRGFVFSPERAEKGFAFYRFFGAYHVTHGGYIEIRLDGLGGAFGAFDAGVFALHKDLIIGNALPFHFFGDFFFGLGDGGFHGAAHGVVLTVHRRFQRGFAPGGEDGNPVGAVVLHDDMIEGHDLSHGGADGVGGVVEFGEDRLGVVLFRRRRQPEAGGRTDADDGHLQVEGVEKQRVGLFPGGADKEIFQHFIFDKGVDIHFFVGKGAVQNHAAHPFRNNKRGLEENLRLVKGLDGLEVLNGSTSVEACQKAARYAMELGYYTVGCSDCHVPEKVGVCATWFPEEVHTMDEFLEVFRKGEMRPAYYADGEYHILEIQEYGKGMPRVGYGV